MSNLKQKRIFVRPEKNGMGYTIDVANEFGESVENFIISSSERTLEVVERKIKDGYFIKDTSLSMLRGACA